MNFIKNQSGGLIVQEDLVTIFKKTDKICTTFFVKETVTKSTVRDTFGNQIILLKKINRLHNLY